MELTGLQPLAIDQPICPGVTLSVWVSIPWSWVGEDGPAIPKLRQSTWTPTREVPARPAITREDLS